MTNTTCALFFALLGTACGDDGGGIEETSDTDGAGESGDTESDDGESGETGGEPDAPLEPGHYVVGYYTTDSVWMWTEVSEGDGSEPAALVEGLSAIVSPTTSDGRWRAVLDLNECLRQPAVDRGRRTDRVALGHRCR